LGSSESASRKGSGMISIFLMGLLGGFVMSPCIGPVVLTILLFVSSTGNAVLGFLYLLAFGYGLGVLLLLVGTFSSLLQKLPKSGGWLAEVKKVLGLILFFTPLYFWFSYLEKGKFLIFAALWFFLVPILTGWFKDYLLGTGGILKGLISGSCVFLSLLLMMQGTAPASTSADQYQVVQSQRYLTSIEEAIAVAKAENKPVLVDFYASWCTYCKQYDRLFKTDRFTPILEQYVLLKIDYDEDLDAVRKFGVKGVPTLLLLNSDGSENVDSRIIGWISPEELYERLLKHVDRNHLSN